MKVDLLLANGTVVDPAQGIFEKRDIAVGSGRILKVENLDVGKGLSKTAETAARCIDLDGKIATPGFIDLHVHVFAGISHYGVDADPACLAKSVTTAVDAGSAGAQTFPGFRRYIIDASETRLRAFLNISSQGMLTREVGELEEIRYADVARAVQVCESNRDVILGIKVRLTPDIVGNNALQALMRAREAAEATGLPVMVHPNASELPLERILAELGKGDILTHCFHGRANGILDDAGRVKAAVHRAVEQGVLLDVGHGQGSFSFAVARAALAQGIQPSTISSDLHHYNINGPVFDLATTVSKFLALGLPMDEVIRKVTASPALALNFGESLGTLREGSPADISVFELEQGAFPLQDCEDETVFAGERLVPYMVIRAGQVVKFS